MASPLLWASDDHNDADCHFSPQRKDCQKHFLTKIVMNKVSDRSKVFRFVTFALEDEVVIWNAIKFCTRNILFYEQTSEVYSSDESVDKSSSVQAFLAHGILQNNVKRMFLLLKVIYYEL
ncbi:uncharacterized protein G2W53_029066 [Senna tora]|uniref:Uncharacterized protein n=1 Tax=Senna tora TaxID=362788 RepID=A0A834T4I5_9FABA|nr:uncharacterized protein G2W53_029066 [Senna tora]